MIDIASSSGSRILARSSLSFSVPMALGAIAAMGLLAAGCKVDRAAFDRRVFTCDTAASDQCGTDEDGRPMACFAARQIGGADFCAKTCPADPAAVDGVCLDSKIELRSCKPSDDVNIKEGAACNQPGLSCYRTDLLSDEGVCTTLKPCSENTECLDPVRSVCATSFLESTIYPQAGNTLKLDHLFCLQTGCKAQGTSCSPGETCLQDVVPADAHPPDICVPNCDSLHHCPPNFLCYRGVSSAIAPNVCIPGLLGFTCSSPNDCMVGRCVDLKIGYSVCASDCDTDGDCKRFDGEQGKFSCVKNPADPSALGLCQTPDAFRGSICNATTDCRNPAEVCTRFAPTDAQGVCLLPCPADGKCSQRGGVGHTCLATVVGPEYPGGVCFPGYFGYPCSSDSNCVGNETPRELECLPTSPAPGSGICTSGCDSDADCGKATAAGGNRWIAGDGFCGKYLGNPICLPKGSLPEGTPCKDSSSCESQKCNPTDNTCAPVAN